MLPASKHRPFWAIMQEIREKKLPIKLIAGSLAARFTNPTLSFSCFVNGKITLAQFL